MEKHPIDALMGTTMDSIKDMVDVNTVVGDPVQAADGTTIIPVSRVSFGFAAGGGEYGVGQGKAPAAPEGLPFAGGSGAGVSLQPVGFLVLSGDTVRMLPATCATVADRVVDLIPTVVEDVKSFLTHE